MNTRRGHSVTTPASVTTLAIDTSTQALGLALETREACLFLSIRMGFRHAETLVPWVERLLAEADVEAGKLELVVVASGPGSFTGLRIGMATAKGLAAGAGCGIVGVPTLDAWAWQHRSFPGYVVPLIDARKQRLYAAFYRSGARQAGFMDVSRGDLVEKLSGLSPPLLLTGPHASRFAQSLVSKELPFTPAVDPLHAALHPTALLRSGRRVYEREGSHGEALVPLYVRGSQAELARRGAS